MTGVLLLLWRGIALLGAKRPTPLEERTGSSFVERTLRGSADAEPCSMLTARACGGAWQRAPRAYATDASEPRLRR